jgi:hypothetical protein
LVYKDLKFPISADITDINQILTFHLELR